MELTRRAFLIACALVGVPTAADAHHRPGHRPQTVAPVLTLTEGADVAKLSWSAASKVGTTVAAYVPLEAGAALATLGPGVLTFTDDSATTGTAYAVRADFADGTSVTSTAVTYTGASTSGGTSTTAVGLAFALTSVASQPSGGGLGSASLGTAPLGA